MVQKKIQKWKIEYKKKKKCKCRYKTKYNNEINSDWPWSAAEFNKMSHAVHRICPWKTVIPAYHEPSVD